jgi:hypothetical protein
MWTVTGILLLTFSSCSLLLAPLSDACFSANAFKTETPPFKLGNPPLRRLDQRLCRLHRWADKASAEVAPRYFQRGHIFQEECVKKSPA